MKYVVLVTETITYAASVIVEAETTEEAEAKAVKQVQDDKTDTTDVVDHAYQGKVLQALVPAGPPPESNVRATAVMKRIACAFSADSCKAADCPEHGFIATKRTSFDDERCTCAKGAVSGAIKVNQECELHGTF